MIPQSLLQYLCAGDDRAEPRVRGVKSIFHQTPDQESPVIQQVREGATAYVTLAGKSCAHLFQLSKNVKVRFQYLLLLVVLR
ncbi:MAG TPA: hypothetical protein VHA14_03225 [Bryobacteraceae bacterium]|nr:hypothetical protein [Bryobacteraceae bacterium]